MEIAQRNKTYQTLVIKIIVVRRINSFVAVGVFMGFVDIKNNLEFLTSVLTP